MVSQIEPKAKFILTKFVSLSAWMYTVWAGVVLLGGICILTVSWKGEDWRMAAEMREAAYDKGLDDATLATTAPQ